MRYPAFFAFLGLLWSVPTLTGAKGVEVEGICDDGDDNDADGWTDCDDADCLDVAACDVPLPPEGRASYMFQESPAVGDDGVADVPILWARRATALEVLPGATLRVYGALVSNVPESTSGGVYGWSTAIAADGDLHVVAATTEGTAAAIWPVGRRAATSFELTEVVEPTENGGTEGVISAVLLTTRPDPESPNSLHKVGTATVLAIDLRVDDVDSSSRALGCRDGLVGSGQPVDNLFWNDEDPGRQFEVCFPLVFVPPVEPPFKRGDANADDAVNLTDAVVIFRFLYRGGPQPSCLKSADTNDTGGLGITDVIFLLNSLFRSAALPPPPFPGCDVDPTEDALSCDGYPPCAS